MDLFSFLLLTTLSTTCMSAVYRSSKYIKAAKQQYALPMNTCYPKSFGGFVSSVNLTCVEECTPPDENDEQECDRSVIALHYATTDCSGSIIYHDRFTPSDRGRDYPYNCFEQRELEGETINPADYKQNYMILKISHGMMETQTINGTEEEVCVKDESESFYRTFPAITDLCVKGYEGRGVNKKYFWYYAACNNDAAYLERWDGFNCTGSQTGIYPIYKPNGCDNRKWMGQYWYSEVMKCSEPDYTIGEAFRNRNSIIAMIFIFIVLLYN